MNDRPLINNNTETVVSILLNVLDIPHTSWIIKRLRNHPYFPSILSISDTLTEVGLNNVTTQMTYDDLKKSVQEPVIVHIRDNGGMYLALTVATNDKVGILNEEGKIEYQSRESFESSWTGITLLTSRTPNTKELNYQHNRIVESITRFAPALIIIVIIGIITFKIQEISLIAGIFMAAIFIINIGGLFVTLNLLKSQYTIDHRALRSMCSVLGADSKDDCGDLLKSDKAKFFGTWSYADLGALYYALNIIFILVSPVSDMVVPLTISAFLALPIPVWSIYTQHKIGVWCRVCLLIQGLILSNMILVGLGFGLFYNQLYNTVNVSQILLYGSSAVFCAGIFIMIKYSLDHYYNLQEENRRYAPVFYDHNTFVSWNRSNPMVDYSDIETIPLRSKIIGATNRLTVVTNPNCQICKEIKSEISMIREFRPDTELDVVYLTHEDTEDKGYKESLFEIQNYLSTQSSSKIYHQPEELLRSHNNWCRKNKIATTPVLIYNSAILSDNYKPKDIYYLIE